MSFIPLCKCRENYNKDDGWKLLHEIRCGPYPITNITFNMKIAKQEYLMEKIKENQKSWLKGLSIK